MADEVKTGIELEIAHVLFIDTVGYSRLLVDQQRQQLDELNQIVRSTNRFRAAESAGKLIRLPTGDGMALVFSDSPESPAECALEISRALKNSRHLPLRMGIHSGPVSRVVDVNDQCNAAGAGINIAERIMSCGDAGHILLSKRVSDDLVEYAQWRPYLHEIGQYTVKHGAKIALVNLYDDEVGNRALPLRCQHAKLEESTRDTNRRRKLSILIASVALLTLIGATLFFFWSRNQPSLLNDKVTPNIPPKSIAVLPFQNLSDEKANAYFTDGVQDEILTHLVKVADLKVISRTSVMQYGSDTSRNLREIGKALGVAYVLEGSVQRSGGRVRVNAQLVDARTDSHLWAEHYDRDLADVFAIQSELAERIASDLKAQLSPEEKAAIELRPTTDLEAYDLYIRAKVLIDNAVFNTPRTEHLEEAISLLNKAVARDPTFILAYYQLAHAHDQLYLFGVDRTSARLVSANTAIQAMQRLRPQAGETHLALAKHLYWGYDDYDGARKELIEARRTLPNDPLTYLLEGYIDRRQGRWDESTRNLEHAVELDPRNVFFLQQIALSYRNLRRYADMAATLDRALELAPSDPVARVQRAAVELDWHADTKPLHAIVNAILEEDSTAGARIADSWIELALSERDPGGAARALSAMTADGCEDPFPRKWCEGVVARLRRDATAERGALEGARAELEKIVQSQPDYAEAVGALGMVEGLLGDKESAIRDGRRAVELLPRTKDAITGAVLIERLALIYSWVGEKDLAFEQLELAVKIPGELSYGQLRLHPFWDSLRGDPRFERIVASLAPTAAEP
jgi:TolB-like protein/class 3 adenylate cyclase/Flp pilus assembly protein TadD